MENDNEGQINLYQYWRGIFIYKSSALIYHSPGFLLWDWVIVSCEFLVVTILISLGWWNSALEFSLISALDLLIRTPSKHCRSNGFWNVLTHWNSNVVWSLEFSGCISTRCLDNAHLCVCFFMSVTCWLSLNAALLPDSPSYDVTLPSSLHLTELSIWDI